jgi:hypothetical protein
MTHDSRVASALASREGYRMPLTRDGEQSSVLAAIPADRLFPGAVAADAAKAGLMLYLGCWEEAHKIAQNVGSAEGNFWHAIIHRQEPDAWNSNYWFERVGKHPVFGSIQADSLEIVERLNVPSLSLPAAWDPVKFVELCEQAREQPGSPLELAAVELQHREWVRLFEWCARTR